jgi:adenylate cyclase
MTEALTARLAQIKGLTVISRTSAMRYKTEQPPIPEIARALGVDLVVEGSVLQAGDQVRITAQLIDGASDQHLWAQSYTAACATSSPCRTKSHPPSATRFRGP